MTRPALLGRIGNLLGYRSLALGATLLAIVGIGSLLITTFSPYDPLSQEIVARLRPPSGAHLFGTDSFGRDVLTRMGWGTRSSLSISILAVILGGSVGSFLGLVSGMGPDRVDRAVMAIVNILLSLPALLLALLIASVLGSGFISVVIAIAASSIAVFARLIRAEARRIDHELFIEAARSTGTEMWRIVLRHVVPNLLSVLLVASTLRLASALLTEATLSYLGLGIPPPFPTLGNMILEGQRYLEPAVWISLGPGLAIMLLVLGANLVGDGLRDALDPRLRGTLETARQSQT